jgi:hypothetical protein
MRDGSGVEEVTCSRKWLSQFVISNLRYRILCYQRFLFIFTPPPPSLGQYHRFHKVPLLPFQWFSPQTSAIRSLIFFSVAGAKLWQQFGYTFFISLGESAFQYLLFFSVPGFDCYTL